MPGDRPVPNTGALVAPEPSVPSNTYTRAFMHLRSPRSLILAAGCVLAMAAPAAAATAPKPLKAKSATLRSASIERQFCAIKVTSGRGVAKMTLKAPVSGTMSVDDTESPWGRVGRGGRGPQAQARARRLGAGGCAGVHLDVRPQGPAARDPGLPPGWRLRAERPLPVHEAPEGEGVQVRHEARSGVITNASKERLAALGLDLTDHPTETFWDVLLHSAADEAKLKKAGFSYSVRIADVEARDPPTDARSSGRPTSSGRAATRPGSPRCPAGGPPTGSSRTSSRSCARSPPRTPGSSGSSRCPNARGSGARSTASRSRRTSTPPTTAGRTTCRWARTTPASGPPTRPRSSGASS